MSGKQFSTNRYRELGWNYREVRLKQAIRINSMNAKSSDTVNRLEKRGIVVRRIPFLEKGYWVEKSKFSIGATTEYLLGLYSIQEPAAQIPATLFTQLKDSTVLDACSAPGGKTIQMADLMGNTGLIVALDVDRTRLTALSNHLERCRVNNTIVYGKDARNASELNTCFDSILLDMPCSGNFATDSEWFRRRTIKDIQRNAALQREILAVTARMLKDDGEIVYSTCSLEPEENELNIDWAISNLGLRVKEVDCYGQEGITKALGRRLDNSVKNCRRIWPGQTQGFFVCVLKKGESP